MKQFDKDGKEIKTDAETEKARKAAFEQICKKGILVNMSRKQISNMPFDVKTSDELAKTLGVTDPKMIQVRKLLFNPERLSRIHLAAPTSRQVWNPRNPGK